MITVIGNLKGGTGKSTVAFNLAVWLATNGRDVSLFDLDPQATLTDVAQIREEEEYLPAIKVTNDITRLKARKNKEILVDVGTADFESMKLALSLADRLVVPVPPSQADIWSTNGTSTMMTTKNTVSFRHYIDLLRSLSFGFFHLP